MSGNLLFFTPSNYLKPYIKTYWNMQIDTTHHKNLINHRVLPNGDTHIVFNLLETLSNNEPYISGAFNKTIFINLNNKIDLFGIQLKYEYLRAFLRCDIYELVDKQVALSNFFGQDIILLQEQLIQQKNNLNRIKILEKFLWQKLKYLSKPHYIINPATKILLDYRANYKITNIAQKFQISNRQFERVFKNYIGLTPKRFADIRRFWNASNMLKFGNLVNDITYTLGYSDQAHFIKTFKKYSNLTPNNFLNSVDFFQYKKI